VKKILKNDTIKKEKPNIKLYPNHYHYMSGGRIWRSENRGPAVINGEGWYKSKV